MLENFLKNNWRSLLLLATILFAWFVWPTPYYYYKGKDNALFRQNRFTGTAESYWGGLGKWKRNDWDSFHKAKQEDDELKKQTGEPVDTKK
jgi:hypothetical protein